MQTSRPEVFAAGDVVRGPNTVVEAIADGKRAALMIERFLKKEPLREPAPRRLPTVYVEPMAAEATSEATRIETPRAPAEWRKRNFAEVEVALSQAEAGREAARCLRCDIEFTAKNKPEPALAAVGRQSA
jgi:NADH-quinone oxidoreductase subunit F